MINIPLIIITSIFLGSAISAYLWVAGDKKCPKCGGQ